jgi:hypothetical protein
MLWVLLERRIVAQCPSKTNNAIAAIRASLHQRGPKARASASND